MLPGSTHASRVAIALIRAELDTRVRTATGHCAMTDGWRVTLCADEVLYLPVTTEITSLPQLTRGAIAAGTRKSSHRADADDQGCGGVGGTLVEAVTARALAQAAHISREHRLHAGSRQRETGESETEPMLSVLQYSPYSIFDNMPAAENSTCTDPSEREPGLVDPPEAPPTPQDDEPLLSALPAICPAASHRLLWRWSAGSCHCPACGG